MRNYFFYFVYLFLNLIILLNCKNDAVLTETEVHPKIYQIHPEEIKRPTLSKPDDLLNITKFLSGKMQDDDSSNLAPLTKIKTYEEFKKNLTKHWQQYNESILKPFQVWSKDNVPKTNYKVVIYPFSGPDFPNAFTIYPDAEKYILIGLEPGGFVPEPHSISQEKLSKGLNELINSLDSISRLNYFMTNKMKINITASTFPGTTPVFLAYLGLLDIEPISLREIFLEKDGRFRYLSKEEIEKDKDFKKGYFSLELLFKDKTSGSTKYLYYFTANLSNQGLQANPAIIEFLKNQEEFVSTFKAASFLLHYDNFSQIRDFILNRANLIVMDDTGPRIKDLQKDFDIIVYGKYTRPISLWPKMFQKELAELHKDNNNDNLNFKYGYGTLHKTHHLIIAKRKKQS
jgi:hypothetical protein